MTKAAGERAVVLSDGAATLADDRLSFSRYVDPLVEILTAPATATPLTIGVFGTWGSGKSTLLAMLEERLASDHDDRFVRVHFNPWIHRREPNLLVPLLFALQEALAEDPRKRFKESAKEVLSVTTRLAGDLLLGRLSGGSVTLDRIEELQERYAAQRRRIDSETRQLRETLQREADKIAADGARLVVLIDDLDRCDPVEIIDLLESVKLFLDLRNVVVLLAVDKEVIDRGVQVKYAGFPFGEERRSSIGGEYLEKMVQLPLHLHPLRPTSVAAFIAALEPPERIREQVGLLERIAVPNPRKLKRILNILTFTTALIDATPELDELDAGLVVRLVVLQVQHGELYDAAARELRLLPALEAVYANPQRLASSAEFAAFGGNRDAIYALTQRYYDAGDARLSALFADAPFGAVPPELLATALSMIGG